MKTESAGWNYVRGLEPLSLCDWPGKATCVIFLGGCNLYCPTCHNFDMAWHMEKLPVLPRADIKSFLRNRAKWLDGVTITGGEPATVPNLGEILLEIRNVSKLPIKMDSNGMLPEIIEDILQQGLVEKFAIDVKGPYEKYPALTGQGVTAETAQKNLERVFELAKANPDAFYFRLTKVPILTDDDVEIAKGYLPDGFDLTIQKYIPPRREHAHADNEAGRPVGNMVDKESCTGGI
ncbi:pyruvate formate lyase activating enzyme [Maridesulfovibrio ferrireducens]|uniref:Pyruvate formate lyase activating enzyme n=1 Tax=Maridesulfovibrio ferrireducens TaxID=246191 RepID=A0A1G9FMM3_9BACT|nr:anaerobic ribonucleoside-triphosphate reductase activating protein [Maridesulfovibrio ferrireducens]SDK89627.1 pyruvate formate lyase activating enzyme [Maridesulfovibrio ferrireducens]